MKRTMKKMVSLGLVAAISLTMLVGCGNSKETADNTASDNTANDTSDTSVKEETKTAENAKIGVLVQDVSGEEALGFRTYYEDYVANQYGVTFTYTDELKDAASEKSAIEKSLHRDIRQSSLFQVMIVHCRLKPVRKIRFIMRLLLELLIRSSLKNIRQMSTSLVRLDQAWIQSMKLV